jgi:hypothetical protein
MQRQEVAERLLAREAAFLVSCLLGRPHRNGYTIAVGYCKSSWVGERMERQVKRG